MFFLPPSSPPLETAGVEWLGTVGTRSSDSDDEGSVVALSVSTLAAAVSVGVSVSDVPVEVGCGKEEGGRLSSILESMLRNKVQDVDQQQRAGFLSTCMARL